MIKGLVCHWDILYSILWWTLLAAGLLMNRYLVHGLYFSVYIYMYISNLCKFCKPSGTAVVEWEITWYYYLPNSKEDFLVDETDQHEVFLMYFMTFNSFCYSGQPLTIFMTNLPCGHPVNTAGFMWPIVNWINGVFLYSLLWYLSK